MKSTNKETEQSRRQFISGMAATFAATASATLLSGHAMASVVDRALAFYADSGTTPPNSYTPKLFSPVQLALLAQVVDVVIPPTDTPGALAVNCHRFIDDQLFHCYDQTTQRMMLDLLALINKHGFSRLSSVRQTQLLSNIEQAKNGFSATHRSQFKQLKALICFGYYTSRAGATQELKYQAIPNGYQGSVPLSEVGRSWGSIAYY